jgi:hypothetical protein
MDLNQWNGLLTKDSMRLLDNEKVRQLAQTCTLDV